jgi:hypothetical protein
MDHTLGVVLTTAGIVASTVTAPLTRRRLSRASDLGSIVLEELFCFAFFFFA